MNVSQQFASVGYTCKVCKKPGVTKFGVNCPQEWLDKLHPMLTHNKCADVMVNFQKAGDRLVFACLDIARGSAGSDKLARSLDSLTRAYAKAFADRHDTAMVFSVDFTDMLRLKPEDVGTILAQYRKQVFASQQSDLPKAANVSSDLL